MKPTRILGIVITIIGIIVIGICLLADVMGIGSSKGVFGYKQIIGIIAGVIVAIAGIILIIKK